MFVCVRNQSSVGLINNTITSIPLPKLHRSYVYFHSICSSTSSPSDGSTAQDCQISCGIYKSFDIKEERYTTDIFFSMLSSSDDWIFHDLKIPLANMHTIAPTEPPLKQRLRFLASFDTQHGGFGLDNVHLHTPQM